jgi:hypothetical protein
MRIDKEGRWQRRQWKQIVPSAAVTDMPDLLFRINIGPVRNQPLDLIGCSVGSYSSGNSRQNPLAAFQAASGSYQE